MKKIIIPRKDHEIYFIKPPDKIKNKNLKQYINDQLEQLHPAFSVNMAVDMKKLQIKEKIWIMATVMDETTLTEYRILNKDTLFFTNTSIAVHKKEFYKNGIIQINDEKIGYDDESASQYQYLWKIVQINN